MDRGGVVQDKGIFVMPFDQHASESRLMGALTPLQLLSLHPYLSVLTPCEAATLLTRAVVKRFPAGRVVFQQEERCDGLYGVLTGRVAFNIATHDGKTLLINIAKRGETFGDISLLDGKGHLTTALARDASELLFIPRREFMAIVSRRPDMMLQIMEHLCGRLRGFASDIADLAYMDTSRRLARQLVALSTDDGEGPEPSVLVSQAELASMLGLSREHVSRKLIAWSDQGILEQKRGRIIVRNAEALEQIAAARD